MISQTTLLRNLLSHTFQNDSKITIQNDNGSYCIEVCDSKKEITPEVIRATLDVMREAFGKERMKRIIAKPELELDMLKYDSNTLVLTKDVMRKIFIGLSDAHKDDLDSIPHYHDRITTLFPFGSSLEYLSKSFLDQAPKLTDYFFDRSLTSGKGFIGLIERVFFINFLNINLSDERDPIKKQCKIVEALTSQLADREFQENTVIKIDGSYYHVDKVFIKDGAYVSILKGSANEPLKVICRGTAARPGSTDGWNTLLNDLLIEVGTKGVKGVWPELKDYLTTNKVTNVEIYGKSLGGAQAMALSVLIEGILRINVDHLYTFATVGAGYLKPLFNSEILDRRSDFRPFEIDCYRIAGKTKKETDFIPIVGGVHLGEGIPADKANRCKVNVTYIQPGKEEACLFPINTGFFSRVVGFIFSFGNAHLRQTTLGDFSYKVLSGDECQQHLRVGLIFEKWRLALANVINFFTRGSFNGESFETFYQAQKTLHTQPVATGKLVEGVTPILV